MKIYLRFINSDYVCAAGDVSQVCINNSEKYLPLEEVFVGHMHNHTLKKRMDCHLQMLEVLGKLYKLGGLLQPKVLSNDYPWGISYLLISNGFNLLYSIAGQVLAAAECLPQVVKVEDKPRLQEE